MAMLGMILSPEMSAFQLLLMVYIIVQVFNLEMAAFSRREKEISRGTPSSSAAPVTSTITPPSSTTTSANATTTTRTTAAASASTTAAAAAAAEVGVDSVAVSSTLSETVISHVQSTVAG